jgi:hypothetical protein
LSAATPDWTAAAQKKALGKSSAEVGGPTNESGRDQGQENTLSSRKKEDPRGAMGKDEGDEENRLSSLMAHALVAPCPNTIFNCLPSLHVSLQHHAERR